MAQASTITETRRTARCARSVGQASRLMEEKLDAALQAGTIPMLDARKMQVRLSLGPRKPVILVKPDGTVTSESKIVYEKLGVPAPSIYPYEQGFAEWQMGEELLRSSLSKDPCDWQGR